MCGIAGQIGYDQNLRGQAVPRKTCRPFCGGDAVPRPEPDGGEAPVLRPAERRRIGVRLSEIKALLSRADPQPWYGQLMLPQAIAYFLQLDHWLRIYRVRLL